MHDADAQAADRRHQMHGQPGEARAGGRCAGGDDAQFVQNPVRACHHVVAGRDRIGATASGADIGRARDLGLDVAAQRAVRRYRPLDGVEPIIAGIEPMEVAVVDDRDIAALAPRQPLDRLRGGEVSIKAADQVKRLGAKIRPPGEHGRIVGIVARTDAARGQGLSASLNQRRDPLTPTLSPQAGRGRRWAPGRERRVHSAASLRAPPQLEPWPAVHP
jgi:hypothetical protein